MPDNKFHKDFISIANSTSFQDKTIQKDSSHPHCSQGSSQEIVALI